PLQQRRQLVHVLVAHLLLDAVRAEVGDPATHVDMRLVDRVAERLARVAADHERALLREEAAHVADGALDHDVHALHRDPAPRGRVPADHHQPAAPRRANGLRRVPVHDHRAGHDVLGAPHPHVAVHAHRRLLVHAGAVVARVPLDLDLDRRVDTYGERVRSAGIEDTPAARRRVVDRVQCRVQLAEGGDREVELRGLEAALDSHQTAWRSQLYTRPGSGSHVRAPSAPGSTAIARYSEAIATQSLVSAITAGLHAIGSRSTANPSIVPTANV